MPTNVLTDQWKAVLERVKQRVPSSVFQMWFKNTMLAEHTGDALVLGVPNLYYKEYLASKYADMIGECAAEAGGTRPKVSFRISPELFRRFRESQNAQDGAEQGGVAQDEAPASTEGKAAVKPQAKTHVGSSGMGGLNPDFRIDNFIAGQCNRIAFNACLRLVEAPAEFNPLYLHGASGVGKTHLLHALGHALRLSDRQRVLCLSAEEFTRQFASAMERKQRESFRLRFRNCDALLVDDAQALARGSREATQEEFLHLVDEFRHAGKQVVIVADAPPSEIEGLKDKLTSRFACGLVVELERPDAMTRLNLAREKSRKRGLALNDECLDLIAQAGDGDVHWLEGTIAKISALARLGGEDVTSALVKKALSASIREHSSAPKRISMESIVKCSSEVFGLAESAIRGKDRSRLACQARSVALMLSRELTGQPLVAIGLFFGKRSHATVLASIKTGEEETGKNERLAQAARAIRHQLIACQK